MIQPAAYENQWQQSLVNVLRPWPLWSGGTHAFTERYVPGTLMLLGYGTYGLVFAAKRRDLPQGQRTVAVKFFRLPTDAQNRNSELRALIYLKALSGACPGRCPVNTVCYVDHFRARLGSDWLVPLIVQFGLLGRTAAEVHQYLKSPGLFPDLLGARPTVDQNQIVYFIETRYETGETLHDAIKRGFWADRAEPAVNYHVMFSAATALQFMHRANLVHQDVKPMNINVINLADVAPAANAPRFDPPDDALPQCVLLDLGLTCRVENSPAYPYEPGVCSEVMNSYAFRAPRQVELQHDQPGAERVDLSDAQRRSWDVYALGMTLYDWAWHISVPPVLTISEVKKARDGTFNADAYPAPAVPQSADFLSRLKRIDPSRLPTKPYWPLPPNDDSHGFFNNLLARMLDFDDDTRITIEGVVAALVNYTPTSSRASSRASSPAPSSTSSPSSSSSSFRSAPSSPAPWSFRSAPSSPASWSSSTSTTPSSTRSARSSNSATP
jgi:serine/threonine protein kinase